MKKLLLALLSTAAIASGAFAGETYSGKEMKQVAATTLPGVVCRPRVQCRTLGHLRFYRKLMGKRSLPRG